MCWTTSVANRVLAGSAGITRDTLIMRMSREDWRDVMATNLDGMFYVTKAVVRGKTYYRVSAAGFARDTSRSMCSTVKSSGHGCIAWAANAPLPGAVDNGIRMAAR